SHSFTGLLAFTDQLSNLQGVTVEPKEDNLFEWKCAIKADVSMIRIFVLETFEFNTWQSDSPYKNGTFRFTLSLPDNFPFKPPTVTFATKIYHPGINEEGAICVPILRDEVSPDQYDINKYVQQLDLQWKPMTTLSTVLYIIQEKLNNPSADDPFEPEIAAVLKNDKTKFLATAKEWTKK
ncbi:hypothetical protein CVT24_010430, partial [Panaeolus cyanescens]